MAKLIGALAGAAITAGMTTLTDQNRVGGRVCRLAHDYITVDPAQNDTVVLAKLDWDTLLDANLSVVEFDDFGTAITLDIGDVTFPSALLADQDIATAAGTVSPLKSLTIVKRKQPLWQMLGYADIATAKKVGPRCELLATFMDGNPGAGTLGWSIYGSPQ